MHKAKGFFIVASVVSSFLLFLTTKAWVDVGRLAREYPIQKYEGPKESPQVVWSKHMPRNWIPITQVSKKAYGAVLVSEDWAFFNHKGYDPTQIRKALKENFRKHRYSRGASTITQQMVKNVFLSREKSLWRKFREFLLTLVAEQRLGKRKILEVYLNIAEWGEGVYGIGLASHFYFGKSPIDLNAKEGAFLAMLLPNPKKYGVSFRKGEMTPYARQTVDAILTKMVRAGYVTQEEASEAAFAPLTFEITSDEPAEIF